MCKLDPVTADDDLEIIFTSSVVANITPKSEELCLVFVVGVQA